MAKQAITRQCPFEEELFLFQIEPDALEDEEYHALLAHLNEDPLCPVCDEQSFRNLEFLDVASAVREVMQRKGARGSEFLGDTGDPLARQELSQKGGA